MEEIPQFLLGGANFDGQINIQDVIITVNFVLGIAEPTQEQIAAADMNTDGVLNVLDVIQIANLTLDN